MREIERDLARTRALRTNSYFQMKDIQSYLTFKMDAKDRQRYQDKLKELRFTIMECQQIESVLENKLKGAN